jgi:hypothetical protein
MLRPPAVIAAVTNSVSKSARNCCTAMKFLYPAKSPHGLAQIAVSALLRTGSIEARDVLSAEHCRYGTKDLLSVEKPRAGTLALRFHYDLFSG